MKIKWAILTFVFLSNSVLAVSQPFKFKGYILKGGCSVRQTEEVSLGKIELDKLRSSGYSDSTPFKISFYNCDTVIDLAVAMRFTADTYSGVANKIKPSVSPDNTKYAIGVYFNNKPIVLNGDVLEPIGYSGKIEQFDMNFTARLEALDKKKLVPGHIEGSLFFEVEYN